MTVVASAVIEIRDQFLACIPNNMVLHQVRVWRPSILFAKCKKRLLVVCYPEQGTTCGMLIYCMHRNTFVPIAGNRPEYPGLYVLHHHEFPVRAYDARNWDPQLMISKLVDRNPDGSTSYQHAKLFLG